MIVRMTSELLGSIIILVPHAGTDSVSRSGHVDLRDRKGWLLFSVRDRVQVGIIGIACNGES
jgi:hypothetical protein